MAGFFVRNSRSASAAQAEESIGDEQQTETAEEHQPEPAEGPRQRPVAVLHRHKAAVDRVHSHPGKQRRREEAAGHCPEHEILHPNATAFGDRQRHDGQQMHNHPDIKATLHGPGANTVVLRSSS